MKAENQQLKNMLNQVTSNYNALQMHLFTLMQNRKSENSSDGHGLVDGKVEDDHDHHQKKINDCNEAGAVVVPVVPRRFMDLGLATNVEADETSLSSSEERRSESVKNGHGGGGEELEKKEVNRGLLAREDSPDQSSQGWGQNKVPRTMSSGSVKDADQAEATMRKARVSVRARSEAPMVINSSSYNSNIILISS